MASGGRNDATAWEMLVMTSSSLCLTAVNMDRCTKFKLFNCLLLLSLANVLLYRFFSRPDVSVLARQIPDPDRLQASLDLYLNSEKERRNILSVNVINNHNIINSKDISNNITIKHSGNEHDIVYDNSVQLKPTSEIDFRRFIGDPRASSISSPLSPPETMSPSPQRNSEKHLTLLGSINNTRSMEGYRPQVVFSETSTIGQCPLIPPRLNGPLRTITDISSWEEIAKENPGLMPGGRFKPADCQSRHRVAIIIPYRNREVHLKILLKNLHPMLARQQLDYGIFVIDQALPGKFNRAMLMNIGYAEAMKRYNYQCAVFHDVDLVPENDRNIYSCPEMPRHMSAAIDKFHYRLPYTGIYGGVSAVSKEQFEKLNGFSNIFFGWGGEDDDMAFRITKAGFKITRYPMDIARYKMLKHVQDAGNEQNPLRFALLKSAARRMATDGLNSLVYDVLAVEELPTHLRIQVLLHEDQLLKQLRESQLS